MAIKITGCLNYCKDIRVNGAKCFHAVSKKNVNLRRNIFENRSREIKKQAKLELLTIKTVDTPIEAHLLKSRLANEGIVSFIFDENMIALNPLFNLTLGGIKLKVHSSDWENAQKIIKEIDSAVLTDDNDELVKCPRCQSIDLYYGFKSMTGFFGVLSAILSIFAGSYPLYFKSVYKCRNCGVEFKKKNLE